VTRDVHVVVLVGYDPTLARRIHIHDAVCREIDPEPTVRLREHTADRPAPLRTLDTRRGDTVTPVRIAYDTEFIEQPHTIELISIGLVDVDLPDRQYYAVNGDLDVGRMMGHPWLVENVAPSLPLILDEGPPRLDHGRPDVRPHRQIAAEVAEFLLARTGPLQLWADYAAYDHVVMSWLWGPMIDRPAGIPMWTHDLRHRVELLNAETMLPEQTRGLHNALDDAAHLARRMRWLDGYEQRRHTTCETPDA
jgi:hypothetical protein